MKTHIFKYSKKHLNTYLRRSIIWIGLGVLFFIVNSQAHFPIVLLSFGTALFGGGLYDLVIWFFKKQRGYIIIVQTHVTKTNFFAKKIRFTEIIETKKSQEQLSLFTGDTKLTLNSLYLETKDWNFLQLELQKRGMNLA